MTEPVTLWTKNCRHFTTFCYGLVLRLWFGTKEVKNPGQRVRRKYPKGVKIQDTGHQDDDCLFKH